MSWSRHTVLLAMLPFSAGAGMQSALHPKGEVAGRIAEISWIMFIGGAVIFLLVLGMLTLALYGPARARALLGRRSLVVGAGIAFPLVVLTALLSYALKMVAVSAHADTQPAVRVEVLGEMWWWRVRYLDQAGRPLFETANDIRIPAGVPVEFILKSDNVIHSFWVPNLAGKLDMVPGQVNRLRVQAREPGFFRGQCAEYCGAQHARMMFDVQALTPEDYDAWLASQRQPARAPTDDVLRVGKRIVMMECARCHTIRGTEATGTSGPDLTHIGSRSSIASGVLPNNVGTLAGWIAGSQQIKPGNEMPDFNELSGEQLRAVAQYMESLE